MLNGVKIDPHHILEDLEERIKAIEHNNFMNQTRTEALENWVLKQEEQIDKLSDKLSTMDVNGAIIEESKEIEALKKKVLWGGFKQKLIFGLLAQTRLPPPLSDVGPP